MKHNLAALDASVEVKKMMNHTGQQDVKLEYNSPDLLL